MPHRFLPTIPKKEPCQLANSKWHAFPVYYEDQKDEAIRASKEFVKARLPMFLAYFERVLSGKASGDGPWLYGGRLTYADLVLFQVSLPTPSLPLSAVELEG